MNYICFSPLQMSLRRSLDYLSGKQFVQDNAKSTLVIQGGCLRVAVNAGIIRKMSSAIGVMMGSKKSILPLYDKIVVVSGGAALLIAEANGMLDRADEILQILASVEFVDKRKLVKRAVCDRVHPPAAEHIKPAVDVSFALKALKKLGVDLTMPEKLKLNVVYVATEHETGNPYYIENPKGEEEVLLALLATMNITALAGPPVKMGDKLLRDGGHSFDPTGLHHAIENSSHVTWIGNIHPSQVKPDSGIVQKLIATALSQFRMAWIAYSESHLAENRINDLIRSEAHNLQNKTIMANALVSNSRGETVCVQTIHPPEDYALSPIEIRADKLREGVAKGEEIGQAILDHMLEVKELPDYVPPAPQPAQKPSFIASAAATSNELLWVIQPATTTAFFAGYMAAAEIGHAAVQAQIAYVAGFADALRTLPAWMIPRSKNPTDPPPPSPPPSPR